MKKRVCILIAVLCLLNATDMLFACGWQPGSVYIDAKLTVSQNWGYPGDIVIFDASQSTATSGYVIKSYKFIVFRNGVYSHDYTEDSTLRDGKFDYKYSCYFSRGGSYTAVVEVTAEKNGQQEKETSNQVGVTIDGSDGCIAYMPFTQESYNAYNCSNPSLTDSRYFDVGDYSNNNSGRFRAWFAGYISWWDSVNNCIDPIKSKLFPSRKVNDHPNYATQAGDMVSFMQNDMCNNPPTYNAPSWENYFVDYQWIEVDPIYGDNSGNKRFSTAVWVKPSGLQNQPVAQRTGWLVCLEPVNDAYKVHFYINGTVDLDSESTINQNTWAHVSCTYDGLVKRIYINGNLDTELADTGAVIPYGSKLQIGKEYKGYMDEFYLCKKTISSDSIVSKASLGTKGWKLTPIVQNCPFTGDQRINSLVIWNGDLYAGVGTIGSNIGKVYKWNSSQSQWEQFGSDFTDGCVYCMAVYNDHLYVGLTNVGSSNACLHRWTGSTWQDLTCKGGIVGGIPGKTCGVKGLYVYNSELIVAGYFKDIVWNDTGSPNYYPTNWTRNIIRYRETNPGDWDPGDQINGGWWKRLAAKHSSSLYDGLSDLGGSDIADRIVFAEYNNKLIIAGGFASATSSGGSTYQNIATWSYPGFNAVTSFGSLGDHHPSCGPNTYSEVNAMAVYDSKLYICGDFSQLARNSANEEPRISAKSLIAYYDGTTWHSEGDLSNLGKTLGYFGNYLDGFTYANDSQEYCHFNAMTVYKNKLIVAGKFVKVGANADNTGGVTVSNIAAWDGNQWSTLGAGVSNNTDLYDYSQIYTILNNGNELLVGGWYINRSGSNYNAIKNFAIWENP